MVEAVGVELGDAGFGNVLTALDFCIYLADRKAVRRARRFHSPPLESSAIDPSLGGIWRRRTRFPSPSLKGPPARTAYATRRWAGGGSIPSHRALMF